MIIDWLRPCPSLCTDAPPPPPLRKPSPIFPEGSGEQSVHGLALSTRIRFLFKKDISFSGLAYRPHVSSEMVTENAGFSLTCGRTKVEVFDYDDVIHDILLAWRMLRKGCYRIYIALAFPCGRGLNFTRILLPWMFFQVHIKHAKSAGFSSLIAAGDVSRGGTSATQRQKFHTDDAKSVRNPVGSADWSTE